MGPGSWEVLVLVFSYIGTGKVALFLPGKVHHSQGKLCFMLLALEQGHPLPALLRNTGSVYQRGHRPQGETGSSVEGGRLVVGSSAGLGARRQGLAPPSRLTMSKSLVWFLLCSVGQ